MFTTQHITEGRWKQNNTDCINTHKASFRYTDLDIEGVQNSIDFKEKKALLFISVGQDYHEAGKFLSTIELVNKQTFSRCDIVLADTLQKHNHQGRLGKDKAWDYAKKAGDLWLERSQYALDKLSLPHHIIRWDTLLNHPDYAALKEQIVRAYEQDDSYRSALHTNVLTYIDRLQLINPAVDKALLFEFGLNYLIEECPIVMPLWAKMGYDFIIYPKPLTPGMRKTRDLFVSNNKCQWLFLRFKKR